MLLSLLWVGSFLGQHALTELFNLRKTRLRPDSKVRIYHKYVAEKAGLSGKISIQKHSMNAGVGGWFLEPNAWGDRTTPTRFSEMYHG